MTGRAKNKLPIPARRNVGPTQTPTDVLAEHAAVIRALGKRVVGDVIEIGRRLAECKAILKEERRWLAWIENEFQWSRNTAENLINVHAMVRDKVSNFDSLNLPISALYLLAAPSTPEEAREAVIEAVADGERLTHAQVKDTIVAHSGNGAVMEQPADKPKDAPHVAARTKGRQQPAKRYRRKSATKSDIPELNTLSWSVAALDLRRHFLDGLSPAEILAAASPEWRGRLQEVINQACAVAGAP
jgi:hypothetical protein